MRQHLPAVLSAVVEFGHADRKTPVRRYVPLDSLTETPGTRALIDAFVQARLFVTDRSDDGRAVVSVAHEALLHHWPRLREWIEKNIDLLFQRTTLTEMAGRWKEAGEDPDLLLEKGKPLDDAEALVEQASATLTETEKAFVRSSTRKRRSQGKYAWLGGLICWTLMVVISARSTGNFSAGSTLVDMLRNNGILILLSVIFVAPIAWTTLMRWRAAPLTKELRAGRIFWAICLIAYAFVLYLGLSIYASPGTGDTNTLGYYLIFTAIAYVAGDKWLRSYRRRRRIEEMVAPAGVSSAFRLPVKELGLLFVFLFLGAWFLINETGNAPKLNIETYRSFVRNSGLPRGIGPLAAGQSDLPYVYYQFSQNAERRTVRVEQVGLPGMCVMAEPTNYQNLAQTIGFKEEACIFEYDYDADGSLRTETAYNKLGQQAWKLQYTLPGQAYLMLSDQKTVFLVFKRSAAGADEEIYQLNVSRSFEGSGVGQIAVRHRMAYDAHGRVSRIQTVDLNGQPVLTIGRTHTTTEFSHDAHGLVTEIRYFSPDGRLILNEKGFAVETVAYDARGNMTGFSFFDADRQPTKSLDGYAEAAITYDGNGKLTEISMLDETGRPVALANGISRWTLDYDDRGNIVGQSVWGLDGGPAWTRVAITAVCCEAQKIGLRAGDIIESYDGREVINHFTLDQRMRDVGLTKRSMTIERDGQRMTFQVSPGLIGAYFSSSGAKDGK